MAALNLGVVNGGVGLGCVDFGAVLTLDALVSEQITEDVDDLRARRNKRRRERESKDGATQDQRKQKNGCDNFSSSERFGRLGLLIQHAAAP